MSAHTKCPWKRIGEGRPVPFGWAFDIQIPEKEGRNGYASVDGPNSKNNADRIVACVNALEGYRPEMVREAIEMLQSIVKSCPETLRALRIDAAKTVAMLEEK